MENGNAIFFAVDDSAQLARAIRRLIEHKEERIRMGKESLAIFSARFMLANVHKEMLGLLEKLTKAR